MDKVIELAREAGAKFEPNWGIAYNVGTETFKRFYTLARADLEAENAKLRFALDYIQHQTHLGHIHDTASAALEKPND